MWSSKAVRSRRTEKPRPRPEVAGLITLQTAGAGTACCGRIVQVTPDGKVLVDFPGNRFGPIAARNVLATADSAANLGEGVPVLLVFENRDAALPIIVGIVRDNLCVPAPQELTLPAARDADVAVDNRKVVIDAKEEIVLRCGKSSITLTKDGKIIIKGGYLVSRSAGLNKIQGAGVKIN